MFLIININIIFINKIYYVDIYCGLAWGDESKGKIVASLAKTGNYNYVCRWADGNNVGHTIYINDTKYKTHLIPSGMFYNIKSIIGPDCVVNIDAFFEEINYLNKHGFNTELIKISPKAHIIYDKHIEIDKDQLLNQQGTTSKGIAPCYSDKYLRTTDLIISKMDIIKEIKVFKLYHNYILKEFIDIKQFIDYSEKTIYQVCKSTIETITFSDNPHNINNMKNICATRNINSYNFFKYILPRLSYNRI